MSPSAASLVVIGLCAVLAFRDVSASPRKSAPHPPRRPSGGNPGAEVVLGPAVNESLSAPPPRCHLLMQCTYHMAEQLVAQCPSQYRKSGRSIFVGHGKNIVVVNVPANDPYVTSMTNDQSVTSTAGNLSSASFLPSETLITEPPDTTAAALPSGGTTTEGAVDSANATDADDAAAADGGHSSNHSSAAGGSHSRNISDFDDPRGQGVGAKPGGVGERDHGGGFEATMLMHPVRSDTCLNETAPKAPPLKPCGAPTWINESDIFDDVAFLVLIGDSTILRTYKYLIDADDADYVERVTDLPGFGVLRNVTALPVGSRRIPVFFLRSLFTSLAPYDLNRAFDIIDEEMVRRNRSVNAAQRPPTWRRQRPMVVFSYGPHDTSWLVFQRAMPLFSKRGIGSWSAGRNYWNKYMLNTVNHLGFNLVKRYPNRALRPVFMFREHIKPDCRHPKYAKSKLAKCAELLAPQVVPYYRFTISALLSLINIPVISLDWLIDHEYCALMDAGHLRRACKPWELQLMVQAFRMIINNPGVIQGHEHKQSFFDVINAAGNFSTMVGISRAEHELPPTNAQTRISDQCARLPGDGEQVSDPAEWMPPLAEAMDEGAESYDVGSSKSLSSNQTAALVDVARPKEEISPRVRAFARSRFVNASSVTSSGNRRLVDMEQREERSSAGVLAFVVFVVVSALWFFARS